MKKIAISLLALALSTYSYSANVKTSVKFIGSLGGWVGVTMALQAEHGVQIINDEPVTRTYTIDEGCCSGRCEYTIHRNITLGPGEHWDDTSRSKSYYTWYVPGSYAVICVTSVSGAGTGNSTVSGTAYINKY